MDFTLVPYHQTNLCPVCFMAKAKPEGKKKEEKAERGFVFAGADENHPPMGGLPSPPFSAPEPCATTSYVFPGSDENHPPMGGMPPGRHMWPAPMQPMPPTMLWHPTGALPTLPALPPSLPGDDDKSDDGKDDVDAEDGGDDDDNDDDEDASGGDGDKKVTIKAAPVGFHPERSRVTDFPCFGFETFKISENATVSAMLEEIGASRTGATVIEQRGPYVFFPRENFRGGGSIKDDFKLKADLGWSKDKEITVARVA